MAGQERVFALGDVSVTSVSPAGTLPATAQVAFQQADYAAWNVWASINGRELLPFRCASRRGMGGWLLSCSCMHTQRVAVHDAL